MKIFNHTIYASTKIDRHEETSVSSVFSVVNKYNYTYEANGNVSELIAEDGSIAAHYEYSPFGKVVHKSGPLADKNPFQFSTKYLDHETQLYYYGYRYYNPENGRWINRDPVEEEGGYNLYNFVANEVPNKYDYLGWIEKVSKSDVTETVVTTLPSGTYGDFKKSITIRHGSGRAVSRAGYTCKRKASSGFCDFELTITAKPTMKIRYDKSYDYNKPGSGVDPNVTDPKLKKMTTKEHECEAAMDYFMDLLQLGENLWGWQQDKFHNKVNTKRSLRDATWIRKVESSLKAVESAKKEFERRRKSGAIEHD